MTSVNSGSRLDRLPIGPFHRRIMLLIGIGMFFDGFDIYLAGSVLGVVLKTGFSTLPQNATFISLTFVGMMLGSFGTGFLGDRFGRRFTYQFNLLVFGLASLAAAFAPNMMVLIACRFVMGVGLGAENVVGYATMTEFVPARSRGKWSGFTTVCVVTGLPVSLLIASLVVPQFGWRAMFVVGGIGALIVWYLRKSLPESPRWLEAVGRPEEAEALMQAPPGKLIVDDQYYTFSSVFFYTNRRALLLNGRVNNLDYGSYAPDAPKDVFIEDEDFRRLWTSGERYYLVIEAPRVDRLKKLAGEKLFHVKQFSGGKYLFTNI